MFRTEELSAEQIQGLSDEVSWFVLRFGLFRRLSELVVCLPDVAPVLDLNMTVVKPDWVLLMPDTGASSTAKTLSLAP